MNERNALRIRSSAFRWPGRVSSSHPAGKQLKGNLTMEYRGYRFTVFRSGTGFKAFAGNVCSRRIYASVYAAKLAAFNFIFSTGGKQKKQQENVSSPL
jgi:hypothetical protein